MQIRRSSQLNYNPNPLYSKSLRTKAATKNKKAAKPNQRLTYSKQKHTKLNHSKNDIKSGSFIDIRILLGFFDKLQLHNQKL